jgi:hypothetical protein
MGGDKNNRSKESNMRAWLAAQPPTSFNDDGTLKPVDVSHSRRRPQANLGTVVPTKVETFPRLAENAA